MAIPRGNEDTQRTQGAIPPCPTHAKTFWTGWRYEEPANIIRWTFDMGFRRWIALVVFADGHETWTAPKLDDESRQSCNQAPFAS